MGATSSKRYHRRPTVKPTIGPTFEKVEGETGFFGSSPKAAPDAAALNRKTDSTLEVDLRDVLYARATVKGMGSFLSVCSLAVVTYIFMVSTAAFGNVVRRVPCATSHPHAQSMRAGALSDRQRL